MKDLVNQLIDIVSELKLNSKTGNHSSSLGLIEQWQILGNKLEAKLYTAKDIQYGEEIKANLKKEIAALKVKKDELGGKDND